MQRRTALVLMGVLLLVASQLSAARPTPTTLAADDTRCFSETGQCISGDFRAYWEQNGGLPVFGFPITPAGPELDPASKATYLTQWFERNRLELHPENQPPYRVLLGRLGDSRLRQTGRNPATLPKANPATPHYYPQTGHAIAEQFWAYWRGHGLELGDPGISERESLALFGYPISEPQMEAAGGGQQVLTQWFERARFEYHPEQPDAFKVLLGLLGNELAPRAASPALDRLNSYRKQVGSPTVAEHPALVTAAQSHASYLATNGPGSNPHVETPGLPGFTGAQIIDRTKAAGYSYQTGYRVSDTMVPLADPAEAVDALIHLPLHRVILLNPDFHEAGYGVAQSSKGGTAYSVLDLGTGPLGQPPASDPFPLAYPTDKQGNVPTGWNYIEFPNPLPPGARLPAGYPFTIQGAYGTLHVDAADMRDAKGEAVPVHPNTSYCADPNYNCYILLPQSPLQPNTTYTVHARGQVASRPFDRAWQFTTGNYSVPTK